MNFKAPYLIYSIGIGVSQEYHTWFIFTC